MDDTCNDSFVWFDPPATTGGNKHGRQDWFWWMLIFVLLTFFLWRISL